MFFRIRKSRFLPVILLLFFLLYFTGFFLTGCGSQSSPPPVNPPVENGSEATAKEQREENEKEELKSVILYFADEHAACLVKEEREIPETVEDPRVFALEALIEGPLDSGLGRTIPVDVKVLDIFVAEETARVNFSAELYSSHWGGSTGEILTVYSIVNTLSQFPGIKQVKIIIDGEEVETLVGHMELAKPLEPDFGLVLP